MFSGFTRNNKYLLIANLVVFVVVAILFLMMDIAMIGFLSVSLMFVNVAATLALIKMVKEGKNKVVLFLNLILNAISYIIIIYGVIKLFV